MRIAIRRSAGVVATVTAAGLLLAGCGSGPGQAGSAAIVNNTAISLDSVQHELSDALASQPAAQQAQSQGQLDAISRRILTERITHQVTAQAAAKYGITATDAEVDQYISRAGGLDKIDSWVASPDEQRATARDQVIAAKYAARFLDGLSVRFDYFPAESQAQAVTEAKQLAAKPSDFAGAVSAMSSQGADANTNFSYTLADYLQSIANPQNQGQQPSVLAPLFGAPMNSIVVFSPNPGQSQSGWLVAKIDSKSGDTPVANPSAAATALAGGPYAPVLASVGETLLRPVAQSMSIRVSPRYGEFDLTSMQVIGSPDSASVVEFPLAGNGKQ